MLFRYLLFFCLFLSVSVGVWAVEGESEAVAQQPIPPTSTAPT
jgi:hypothetical protein